jgi:RNA polymerase sigma-70 factor (ECF subfamily)
MVIDPAKSISGWLFVVSYNKSVSFLKKTLRESVVCNENAGMKYSNELEVNFRETQSILLKEAINKLSPQKRKVLELCKLEGKSYDETAKELRISKHTVKEYLSAAISYIKHDIQKHPNYHSTVVHITILSLLLRF